MIELKKLQKNFEKAKQLIDKGKFDKALPILKEIFKESILREVKKLPSLWTKIDRLDFDFQRILVYEKTGDVRWTINTIAKLYYDYRGEIPAHHIKEKIDEILSLPGIYQNLKDRIQRWMIFEKVTLLLGLIEDVDDARDRVRLLLMFEFSLWPHNTISEQLQKQYFNNSIIDKMFDEAFERAVFLEKNLHFFYPEQDFTFLFDGSLLTDPKFQKYAEEFLKERYFGKDNK